MNGRTNPSSKKLAGSGTWRIAILWRTPAAMATKEVPAGTFVCPLPFAPQPTKEPSAFNAKLKVAPAEMAMKSLPAGAANCPYVLSPQTVSEPSDFSAKLC